MVGLSPPSGGAAGISVAASGVPAFDSSAWRALIWYLPDSPTRVTGSAGTGSWMGSGLTKSAFAVVTFSARRELLRRASVAAPNRPKNRPLFAQS